MTKARTHGLRRRVLLGDLAVSHSVRGMLEKEAVGIAIVQEIAGKARAKARRKEKEKGSPRAPVAKTRASNPQGTKH